MEVVKLAPAFKDYIWGGTKFKSWGKQSSLDKIAELLEVDKRDLLTSNRN